MQNEHSLIDLGVATEETRGIWGGAYEEIGSETHMD